MKNLLLTLFGVSSLFFIGCSSAPTSNQSMSGVSASDSMQSVSQVANMAGLKDRKYIKTSELVCKVKDVQKTTTSIIDLVNRMGGFIQNSAVKNTVLRTDEIEISQDSVLVAQYFETSNEMSFRIPEANFAKTLETLQPMMSFTETFTINSEDVSLNLLKNKMGEKRFEQFEKEVKNKSSEYEDANNLYQSKNEADANQISALNIKDQVAFSTINLTLKQAVGIYKETKPNIENKRLGKPFFLVRIYNSFKEGLFIIEETIVVLSKFWILILAGIFGFSFYKKSKKQNI